MNDLITKFLQNASNGIVVDEDDDNNDTDWKFFTNAINPIEDEDKDDDTVQVLGGITGSTSASVNTKKQNKNTKSSTPKIYTQEEQELIKRYGSFDMIKIGYAKALEFITNTFYKEEGIEDISIKLDSTNKGANYWDGKQIVLSERLMDAFAEVNLPRFLVYYHELGHYLYSQNMQTLKKTWSLIKTGPLAFDEKYLHLDNWIEDFYIEDRLLKEHSYMTDVINCIKKLPPEYDILKIEYAFNYYYVNSAVTPALNYTDQLAFIAYINRLLNLRGRSKTFGKGIISNISVKPSTETQYIQLLIEFYNWCVTMKIFPQNSKLPPLNNPNEHLEQQGTGQDQGQDQGQDPGQSQGPVKTKNSGAAGTSSSHSKTVGRSKFIPKLHIKKATNLFKEELASEQRAVDKQLLDMSQRLQTTNKSLDGLFSTDYKDSSTIQSKIILPNFFNPNRLADQVLFKEKLHTYMNVAIYRDVSGSTKGKTHKLMSEVCEKLIPEIPVDLTYYLYASGDISIIEVPYVKWENSSMIPPVYKNNSLFMQLDGGTNSDAIADVITEQLSDKWLNIIITDGDLTALMYRENIKELLRNVFIVSVGTGVEPGLLGVEINSTADIDKIIPKLATINLDRKVV